MRYIKFVVLGILFGILLVKSEVVIWFRIQEMFRFQSFHMYGVIGSAVFVGAISIFVIRRCNIKTLSGSTMNLGPKPFHKIGNLSGGILFGLGWALVGACPGPLYVLFGTGYTIFVIPIVAAMLGVIVYGIVKNKLPH